MAKRKQNAQGHRAKSWLRWAGLVVLVAAITLAALAYFALPERPVSAAPKLPEPAHPVPTLPAPNRVAVPTPAPAPAARTSTPPTRLTVRTNLSVPCPVPATNEPAQNLFPRPVRNALEAQIALARLGISSGSIDGILGSQTRGAIAAFQRLSGFPETGQLDPATRAALKLTRSPLAEYTISEADLQRLQPLSKS